MPHPEKEAFFIFFEREGSCFLCFKTFFFPPKIRGVFKIISSPASSSGINLRSFNCFKIFEIPNLLHKKRNQHIKENGFLCERKRVRRNGCKGKNLFFSCAQALEE